MRFRHRCTGFAGAAAVLLAAVTAHAAGDPAAYDVREPTVALTLLDHSATESFLGIHVDSEGRLFVGGREAVFAYDPDGQGGFKPPVELFRFPPDSWVYDIVVRGDDLYVQTVTTTFLLPGARTRREGVTARPLLWGIPAGSAGGATYGVHQGLHGLEWGPDGDLRISFGDCVWNGNALPMPTRVGHCLLHTADGATTPLNGTGGVLRLRPDGTGVRLVAAGLRNPCGLAYDHAWNLFTHDNDHEGLPVEFVPGRLIHAADGADFAWPRGWMTTKSPDRKDLLDTMVADLGRTIPVGQAYYDEPLLRQACGDTILLARWCQSTLSAFPKWPHGATFQAREKVLLAGRNFMRPVGVAVAPDGRIFVTTCAMRGNETSPVYASDVLVLSAAAAPPLLDRRVSLVDADLDALVACLAGDSWRLRQGAHVEILRRAGPAVTRAVTLLREQAAAAAPNPQLLGHLVHLAAAAGPHAPWNVIEGLARHADDGVRLQAIRALGSHADDPVPAAVFAAALADPSPPVRLAALEALASFPDLPPEVVTGPARSDDTYLRQAATRLMAERLPGARLHALLDSPDAATRLAAVLAVGRVLTVPPHDFVPPADWTLGGVLGPKIHHEGTIVDLAQADRIGFFTIPVYWAHVREGRAAEFDLLMRGLDDADEAVRLQAAHFLTLLEDPRAAAGVARVRAAATAARAGSVSGPTAGDRPEDEPVDAALAGRLAAAGTQPSADAGAFAAVDWRRAAAGGDAARGRTLFRSIGCGKCHAVAADVAVAGGPSLVGIGKRYAPEFIAESVIQPSKQISELFRGSTIVTDDGRVAAGLVVAETGTELELLLPDATRRTIATDTIEARRESPVSPMPEGLVRTPAELRDILAYLLGPDVN